MRSPTFDRKLIEIEIERLKKTLTENEQEKSNKSSLKSSDFMKNPGRKAMVIGMVLAALNHITGSYALLSYTATIFKESGSIISANESALIVGVIQLIGTFVVPVLIERSGRKVGKSTICVEKFGILQKNFITFIFYFYVDLVCHFYIRCINWLWRSRLVYDVQNLEL